MLTPEQEKNKLSIAYCKKILNKKGRNFSDEQVAKIRDFLYLLASIEYDYFKRTEHEEGDSLHSRIDR